MTKLLKYKSLLDQFNGLSELIPGPLSHSIDTFRKYGDMAQNNIKISKSLIVPDGLGYIAIRSIKKGEEVFAVFGTIIDHQTSQHSIQIGYGLHIDPHALGGRYVNNHCEGNLIIKWDERGLHHYIASKDIDKNEEVSYSYWRSEFEWSENATENEVKCSCGSPKCIGRILSFKQLSTQQKRLAVRDGGIAWYLLQGPLK